MCFPNPNKGTKAAEKAEADRLARVNATTNQVNQLFDSPERAAQREQYGTAVRDFYVSDANRQKSVADRNLRFAMARSGLTGGSATIDANRTMGEEYNRGILESERRAQAALADLMGRDEQSRLNLTGLAQSGLNTTASAQQAAAALRSNLAGAKADAFGQGLGDIFKSVEDTRKRSEEDAARRQQEKLYNLRYPSSFSGVSTKSGVAF
jgi:hypothetical protein